MRIMFTTIKSTYLCIKLFYLKKCVFLMWIEFFMFWHLISKHNQYTANWVVNHIIGNANLTTLVFDKNKHFDAHPDYKSWNAHCMDQNVRNSNKTKKFVKNASKIAKKGTVYGRFSSSFYRLMMSISDRLLREITGWNMSYISRINIKI